MVKTNTREEVNPLYSMPSISSQASGAGFMHGLTLGNPLPSKPCVGVKLSEHNQSMSGTSLEPHGLNLSREEYAKVLNKLLEAKNLRVNPSQEEVLDAEQTITCNHFIQFKRVE